MTIELKHTDLFRHSRKIGYHVNDTVFLTKDISKADQRKVRELIAQQESIDVKRFITVGRFVRH